MVLASLLFFLPALALSSKDSVAIVPAEDLKVCEYFDARIIRLREIVNKELGPDVDIGSDLYTTLEESKLCDTVGYVAIPECVANNGGDECVARKTSELIRKTLRAAMKAEKIKAVPSGEKFFATCKHIGYKNVLKTFKSARTLMSPECGLPGLGGGRSRRSLDLLPALLLGGSYDPSSIWFQYFLCKDIDLYCYFFTQGWTQGQYGQYYLYDNLLDDTTGLFAGATDSNLATIALLGGLGGGIGQPSGYYPSYGAHAASAQGRKRRETRCSNEDDSLPNCTSDRKRRHLLKEEEEEEEERKRREARCSDVDASLPNCTSRKRRQEPEEDEDEERKRRETRCSDVDDSLPNCTSRKRRQEPKDEEEEEERKRRETRCSDVDDSLPNCTRRKRRQEPKEKEEEERKRRETRCSDEDDSLPNCTRRKRRAAATCDDDDDSLPDCTRKRRSSSSEACEACKKNPDSTDCEKC